MSETISLTVEEEEMLHNPREELRYAADLLAELKQPERDWLAEQVKEQLEEEAREQQEQTEFQDRCEQAAQQLSLAANEALQEKYRSQCEVVIMPNGRISQTVGGREISSQGLDDAARREMDGLFGAKQNLRAEYKSAAIVSSDKIDERGRRIVKFTLIQFEAAKEQPPDVPISEGETPPESEVAVADNELPIIENKPPEKGTWWQELLKASQKTAVEINQTQIKNEAPIWLEQPSQATAEVFQAPSSSEADTFIPLPSDQRQENFNIGAHAPGITPVEYAESPPPIQEATQESASQGDHKGESFMFIRSQVSPLRLTEAKIPSPALTEKTSIPDARPTAVKEMSPKIEPGNHARTIAETSRHAELAPSSVPEAVRQTEPVTYVPQEGARQEAKMITPAEFITEAVPISEAIPVEILIQNNEPIISWGRQNLTELFDPDAKAEITSALTKINTSPKPTEALYIPHQELSLLTDEPQGALRIIKAPTGETLIQLIERPPAPPTTDEAAIAPEKIQHSNHDEIADFEIAGRRVPEASEYHVADEPAYPANLQDTGESPPTEMVNSGSEELIKIEELSQTKPNQPEKIILTFKEAAIILPTKPLKKPPRSIQPRETGRTPETNTPPDETSTPARNVSGPGTGIADIPSGGAGTGATPPRRTAKQASASARVAA